MGSRYGWGVTEHGYSIVNSRNHQREDMISYPTVYISLQGE